MTGLTRRASANLAPLLLVQLTAMSCVRSGFEAPPDVDRDLAQLDAGVSDRLVAPDQLSVDDAHLDDVTAPDASGADNQAIGAPSLQFELVPNSAVAGQLLSPEVRVVMLDAQGQRAVGADEPVSLSLPTGRDAMDLVGTLTAQPVDGVAIFDDLRILFAAESHQLLASASGHMPAESESFAVAPDAPVSMLFISGPTDIVAGELFEPPVSIAVVDQYGNTTPSSEEVSIDLGVRPIAYDGALVGTLSVEAIAGVATFSDLTVERSTDMLKLRASAPSFNQLDSDSFAVTPGDAVALTFVQGPQHTPPYAPLRPPLLLEFQDDFGNKVSGAPGDISISLRSDAGAAVSLWGTLSYPASSGAAHFPDLYIDAPGADYQLQAEGAGFVAQSALFDVVTPTRIYRSIGPGNDQPLVQGSGTVEISGSLALFTQPLPMSVGAGDALQYDGDDDGVVDAIAFIRALETTSMLVLQAADGGPVPDTAAPDLDWALFRAYTSLRAAAVGEENPAIDDSLEGFDSGNDRKDAYGKRQVWSFACYGDAADTESVVIDNWNTAYYFDLHIFTPRGFPESMQPQRHDGTWRDDRYNLRSGALNAIEIVDAFIRIDGLQIQVLGSADEWHKGIYLNSGPEMAWVRLSNNIIRGDPTIQAGLYTLGVYATGGMVGAQLIMWNNIIYDLRNTAQNSGEGISLTGFHTGQIYNNTVVGCAYGIIGNVIGHTYGAPTIAINNIAWGNTSQDFRAPFGDSSDFFDPRSDYNFSANTSAPGANSIHGDDSGMLPDFVSYGASQTNLHLNVNSDAVQRGAGLSNLYEGLFVEDIDGDFRGPSWDIGADQLGP